MLTALLSDARVAARTLLKARGFTATAILTLGLGTAVASAVLMVANAYLFTGLPYPGSSRLYGVRYASQGETPPRELEKVNWPALDDVVEHAIAWDLDMFYLIGGEHTESAAGAWVTPGFMQGLGIRPAIGRGFDAEAFAAGAPNLALISHRLWQTRFGGDPNVLGRRFDAYVSDRPHEAEPFTIVGVLPADFWHFNPYTQILTPLRAPTYPYQVRLRAGVSPELAAARITEVVRAGTTGWKPGWRAELTPAHAQYVASIRPIVRTLAYAAGLVLLIAWTNVAGLLLIRMSRRQREIAVRRALGAGHVAIARLVALEALLLGAGAAVLGLVAGAIGIRALAAVIQRELGRPAPGGASALGVDGTVLAGAAAFGALTVLACALAPLVVSWRSGLAHALAAGSRSTTEGRGSQRTRSALIAVEVAASLALLVGSVMMIRSVFRLVRVDLGFRAERVLAVPLALRVRAYPDGATRLALYDRTLARLGAIPGVERVAHSTASPLAQYRTQPVRTEGGGTQAAVHAASPAYFDALQVAVAAGRAFEASDRLGGEPVAVASETLARRLWPGGDAVGRRIAVPERVEGGEPREVWRRIVGVVADVRNGPTDQDLADVYVPLMQKPERFTSLYLRTAGPPAALLPVVRSALKEIDPVLSSSAARPLQTSVDEQLARPKFLASLLSAFASIAALLSLIGIYGVIAYAVRQREREIAVRIAVGAEPRNITSLFLRQGSVLLLAGVALGTLGALALGRVLETLLFGVRPDDPLSLACAAAAFALSALAAIWWPARRAATTDPAAVLRAE